MEHAIVADRVKRGTGGVLEVGIGSVAVLMMVAVVVMESSSSSPSSDIQVEVGLQAWERKLVQVEVVVGQAGMVHATRPTNTAVGGCQPLTCAQLLVGGGVRHRVGHGVGRTVRERARKAASSSRSAWLGMLLSPQHTKPLSWVPSADRQGKSGPLPFRWSSGSATGLGYRRRSKTPSLLPVWVSPLDFPPTPTPAPNPRRGSGGSVLKLVVLGVDVLKVLLDPDVATESACFAQRGADRVHGLFELLDLLTRILQGQLGLHAVALLLHPVLLHAVELASQLVYLRVPERASRGERGQRKSNEALDVGLSCEPVGSQRADLRSAHPWVGLQSPLQEPELLLPLREALPWGSLLLGAAGVRLSDARGDVLNVNANKPQTTDHRPQTTDHGNKRRDPTT
ncbi:hypothetical protein EYF80_043854 [Liparis tanakae]|uniref:Uncharacterized protein n=1 Tax=Liparis tanakae TaxID=230148 RepID=A0A4Z2FZ50_9TELE|nr:hypothetical protein EYF80_043854 [Liparis tanakae]